jgi:tRNA (cmo5U34)-methyltransferase
MSYLSNADSGFDRVAWLYDFLAGVVFGNKIKKAQSAFLDHIPANSRIILIGGGSGWLLKQILLRCSPIHLVYLEASSRMLSLAQRKVRLIALSSQVDFRLGNEQNILPSDCFSVVITPFFLDLFTHQRLQQEIMPRLSASLQPHGIWLFTDFISSPHWSHRLLVRMMYWFFGKATNIKARQLPDYASLFRLFYLQKVKEAHFFSGMIETSIWERRT